MDGCVTVQIYYRPSPVRTGKALIDARVKNVEVVGEWVFVDDNPYCTRNVFRALIK
jgi:hypothetical protein